MKILFSFERDAKAKVAVLISLYNYGKYIRQALDSIAAQTLEHIELIVCNDCSTDNGVSVTMGWMKEHEQRFSRLALIENEVNSGLSATRNASVTYAAAPYVFILDADNMIYPACLARSLEVLEEADDSAAFVYTQREMFDDGSDLCGSSLENLLDWNVFLFSQGNYIDAMALHKKSALQAVGGYTVDDCFGRLGWEDYEIWLKYIRAGFYGIKIQQPLIRYRYHTASMLRSTTTRAKNTRRLWGRLHELYPELIPFQMPLDMRLATSRLGVLEKYMYFLGQFIRSKPRLLRLAKFGKRHLLKIYRTLYLGKILPPTAMDLLPDLSAGNSAAMAQARHILGDFPSPEADISGNYICVRGAATDFSGDTTAVVAHWDPDGVIAPYVVHMCRCFKSMGWRVVIASHAALKQFEETPDGLVDAALYRTCPGYDFTSWKAALHCFPSLLRCNELILCNDSVFGGIGSYAPMHDAMRRVDCDFWGVTASREIMPHIQSYYSVFRRAALQHRAFTRFFDAVPFSDDRDQAISFEVRLTLWLNLHGLKPGVYAPAADIPDSSNPSLRLWRNLLKHNVPMLKRVLLNPKCERLLLDFSGVKVSGWEKELAKRQYPLEYIQQYFLRTQK